jgi:hypothetical protein
MVFSHLYKFPKRERTTGKKLSLAMPVWNLRYAIAKERVRNKVKALGRFALLVAAVFAVLPPGHPRRVLAGPLLFLSSQLRRLTRPLPTPTRALNRNQRLTFADIDPALAKARFRFTVAELQRVLNACQMPPRLRFDPRHAAMTSQEGLLIVLRYKAFPQQLREMEIEFQRTGDVISRIQNYMSFWLVMNWGHLLRDFQRFHADFPQFSQATRDAGMTPPLEIVGFWDCKLFETCTPGEGQAAAYSGESD